MAHYHIKSEIGMYFQRIIKRISNYCMYNMYADHKLVYSWAYVCFMQFILTFIPKKKIITLNSCLVQWIFTISNFSHYKME